MAPCTLHAIALAEHVMQQHVGAARCVWTGIVADDAIEAEQRLDRLALEPAVQVFRRRQSEQVQQLLPQRCIQRRQFAAELPHLPKCGQAAPAAGDADVRWRAESPRAQYIGEDLQACFVRWQALCIPSGESSDFGLGAARCRQQVAVVGQWQEVVGRARDNAQPMRMQLQVFDHLRLQQRHRVRRHRVAEAGMELLGDRRSAEHAAPFKDQHLLSGLRQIGRTDQAVVATPDDDCIPGHQHLKKRGRRGSSRNSHKVGSGGEKRLNPLRPLLLLPLRWWRCRSSSSASSR
ncbi:hypothetical protein LMG26824_03144 [Stenotrophomonas maltophilia]